ncbi:MAG: cell division protein FtsW [Ruminococcaceae bacterium]|nr:cell division protein FtsW [Oscillospiraceae bacterium]
MSASTARKPAVQPKNVQQKKAVPKKAPPKKAQPKKIKPKKEKKQRIGFFYGKGRIDMPMLVITLVLLTIGITMMFSASHALSYRDNDGDSYGYAKSQMIFAAVGLVLMFVISFANYQKLRDEIKIRMFGKDISFTLAHLALLLGLVLMFLIFPFGLSNYEGGPRRWLPLFGRTFQPSDVLKFALIIYFAYYISKNYKKMRYTYVGLVKPAILLALVAWLMYEQPHLSGLVIMLGICGVMLIIGGVNMTTVLIAGALGVAILFIAFSGSEFTYFADRFAYMGDPMADIDNKTYQNYQAILAIGSGGLWGVGFGNSAQKYYYLPDAENDFVFAILCEEFGFVGGALVIILFLIFLLRGFYIARRSEDRFGMLLATGISLQVGVQAMLNIGVNVSCVPNTGISLPFFSYGGTALVIQLAEVGLLLSVSRKSKLD